MSHNVALHVYEYGTLIKGIVDVVGDAPIPQGRSMYEFVNTVLPKFGIIAGTKFITLWNGRSVRNSALSLHMAVDMYFGIEDTFLSQYDIVDDVSAEEVFGELGLEPLA